MDPEIAKRSELGLRRRATQERSSGASERAHDDDRDSQLLDERE